MSELMERTPVRLSNGSTKPGAQAHLAHRFVKLTDERHLLCKCGKTFDTPLAWSAHCVEMIDLARSMDVPAIKPRRNAPEPTKQMLAKDLKDGTLTRAIYEKVLEAGEAGVTDDELEQRLHRAHQSVSAARNRLVRVGLVKDSGERRNNRYMNEVTVWVVAG